MDRLMKRLILIITCMFSILLAQDFDLEKFTDTQKYGWEDFEQRNLAKMDLQERQRLLQIYRMNRLTTAGNLAKSAIVPGWGHFAAQSYTKGQILLGLEVVLLGSSLYFYDQAMDSYDKYQKADQIDEMNQYYNDSLEPYRYSQAFLGLAVIVWIYTLYDTINVTEDYNSNLWNDIIREYNRQNVIITPTGISVRF